MKLAVFGIQVATLLIENLTLITQLSGINADFAEKAAKSTDFEGGVGLPKKVKFPTGRQNFLIIYKNNS